MMKEDKTGRELPRKKSDVPVGRVSALKKLDDRYGDHPFWQFIKFNLVSLSITLLQLLLANLLPLLFDAVTAKLPPFLQFFFRPEQMTEKNVRYVRDGVVTWGFVLPFFLSNLLANIYGYFVNMKATFRGRGRKGGMTVYLAVLFLLILFSTWLQGTITAALAITGLAPLARTIAAMAAGLVQMAVLFPLEKFVLFAKSERESRTE